MPQLNTALRNRQADSIGDAFNSGHAECRSGTRPGVNNAATGTLLVDIPLPADAYAVAASGAIVKNGTWEANAVASGTVGWFRVYNSGNTMWIDFQIGTDATMADAAVVAGNPARIDSATLTQAES